MNNNSICLCFIFCMIHLSLLSVAISETKQDAEKVKLGKSFQNYFQLFLKYPDVSEF